MSIGWIKAIDLAAEFRGWEAENLRKHWQRVGLDVAWQMNVVASIHVHIGGGLLISSRSHVRCDLCENALNGLKGIVANSGICFAN